MQEVIVALAKQFPDLDIYLQTERVDLSPNEVELSWRDKFNGDYQQKQKFGAARILLKDDPQRLRSHAAEIIKAWYEAIKEGK